MQKGREEYKQELRHLRVLEKRGTSNVLVRRETDSTPLGEAGANICQSAST